MNKTYLIVSLFTILLCGCNQNSNKENKIDIFAITNTFLENNEVVGEYTYNKFIHGCRTISYIDSSGNNISLDLADFDIDINTLIGGDALKITHNSKKEIMFQDILPPNGFVDGNIIKIEVEYTNVYEVIMHKNGNEVSFRYEDSSVEYDISLPQFSDGYCITKVNNEITRKEFEDYEDGTKMYYAYNTTFENPLNYTCLYDYNPR